MNNGQSGVDNLDLLPEWEKKRELKKQFFPNHVFLLREYLFDSDEQTRIFITLILDMAENENHHPLLIFEWHKVTISWSTHEKKTITKIDYKLAKKTDEIYKQIKNRE